MSKLKDTSNTGAVFFAVCRGKVYIYSISIGALSMFLIFDVQF